MSARVFTLLNRRIYPPFSQILYRRTVNMRSVKPTSSDTRGAPVFSPNSDENQLAAEARALLKCQWMLDGDNMGIQKTFHFPSFAKALVMTLQVSLALSDITQDFIVLVGIECKIRNHHPELWNVSWCTYLALICDMIMFKPSLQTYRSVYYHWTTHNPRGLSAKDTHMARFCDEKARYFGYMDECGGKQDAAALTSPT